MCGLVGIAGDTTGWRKDLFRNLIVVDQLRGDHSTGVAGVRRFRGVNDPKVELAKQPGGPANLFGTKEYKDIMNMGPKVLLGHNRYATVGAHTIENAHPFAFENLVGAHNGTLTDWDRKKLLDWEKYGTDSEALYATMNEFGVDDTIKDMTGWKTAYALTWYDFQKNTINFLRNQERPLVYTYSHDRTTLIWASEAGFIHFAADHAKVKLQNDGEIYMVEPDTMCSWEIPKGINDKFAPVTKKGVKPTYKIEAPKENLIDKWLKGADYNDNYSVYTYPQKKADKDDQGYIFDPRGKRKDTNKWKPPYKDHKGVVMNKVQIEGLMQQGCGVCGSCDSKWGDFIQPFKSSGASNYDFVCAECYNDNDMFDIVNQLI